MRFFTAPPRPVHILMIVDASSSMLPYQDQVQRALTEFFSCLAGSGQYLVTLVQFADEPQLVTHAEPSANLVFYYSPEGGTALWDGIGTGLGAIDSSHQTVVCFIATDGEENMSRQFTQEKIYGLIQTKQWTGTWSFLWLNMQGSTNHNAKALGIECLDFARADIVETMAELASALARSVTRMRLAGERRVEIRGLLGDRA